jgi:hypothetical protein
MIPQMEIAVFMQAVMARVRELVKGGWSGL